MEKYSSFEKLKKQSHSISNGIQISVVNESKIVDLIDLLKASVVLPNNLKNKQPIKQ